MFPLSGVPFVPWLPNQLLLLLQSSCHATSHGSLLGGLRLSAVLGLWDHPRRRGPTDPLPRAGAFGILLGPPSHALGSPWGSTEVSLARPPLPAVLSAMGVTAVSMITGFPPGDGGSHKQQGPSKHPRGCQIEARAVQPGGAEGAAPRRSWERSRHRGSTWART